MLHVSGRRHARKSSAEYGGDRDAAAYDGRVVYERHHIGMGVRGRGADDGDAARGVDALARGGRPAAGRRQHAADGHLIQADDAVCRPYSQRDFTRLHLAPLVERPYFYAGFGQDFFQQRAHLSDAAENAVARRAELQGDIGADILATQDGLRSLRLHIAAVANQH